MTSKFNIVDLTHSLSPSVPSWDGSCGFTSEIRSNYGDSSEKVSFLVQDIHMHAGIGTHMDAPAHCIKGGKTIDEIAITAFFSPCAVIDVSEQAHEDFRLEKGHIESWEGAHGKLSKNSFFLIRTGWDRFFKDRSRYRNNLAFPSVTTEAANYLLEKEVVGIGIDTLSPDLPKDGYPVHEAILGAGKYIIENVANAGALPPVGSQILALPLKIVGATEAPMRLIALI